jgi:hypothetical protein
MLLHDALIDAALCVRIRPTGDLRQDLVGTLEAFRYELIDRDLGRVAAALVDRAEWDGALHDIKVALVKEGHDVVGELLRGAVKRGELRGGLDVARCTAQLFGPIVYRRLLSGEPVTSTLIRGIVDDFLFAHRQ